MSKTKDKLIDSMWKSYYSVFAVSNPCQSCFKSAASEIYDHRQKEIDELQDTLEREREGHDLHLDEVNRWWAERWITFSKHLLAQTDLSIVSTSEKEMDAAAARVREVKG